MVQKIAHIALAFILFLGSTGLILNKHFCRGELKSQALFVKAKSCHSQDAPSCPQHSTPLPEKKGCCDDQQEFVKAEFDQLTIQTESLPEWNFQISPAPVLLPLAIYLQPDKRIIHFLNYKPPWILQDPQASFQTFRC